MNANRELGTPFNAITRTGLASGVRKAILLPLLLILTIATAATSHSQTTSALEIKFKGQMLYQVYATASACANEGFYSNPDELPGIGEVVDRCLNALNLSDTQRDEFWASAQRILQVTPAYPGLCLDARRWPAVSVPGAFSGSDQEKPF